MVCLGNLVYLGTRKIESVATCISAFRWVIICIKCVVGFHFFADLHIADLLPLDELA